MFNLISLKGGISKVKGFFCDGVNAGLKHKKYDLGFLRSEVPCEISAVFTTNKFQAAPIKHFLKYPKNFKTDFILINSKNANAMTGQKGIDDIDEILSKLNIKTLNPIMSSTGVIGYRLDKKKIIQAFDKFDYNAKNNESLVEAIMTTDSFKKEICFAVESEQGNFVVSGFAKGAGMINPALATMLCYIATDAKVPKKDMDEILKEAVEKSFNAISVDGDTSTNDTVMLLSNGLSGNYNKEAFKEAVFKITEFLALEILKDGEGSSKVVAFEVQGAKNDLEAKKAATCLSNSLLVKTALFGADPNWGRIASTIGASGIECYEDKLEIYYDEVLIYNKEKPELDDETEAKAHKVMDKDGFKITCKLNISNGKFTAYGCDLGHKYVEINSKYRS